MKRWEVVSCREDPRRDYVFSRHRFKIVAQINAFLFDLANGPVPFAIVRRAGYRSTQLSGTTGRGKNDPLLIRLTLQGTNRDRR